MCQVEKDELVAGVAGRGREQPGDPALHLPGRPGRYQRGHQPAGGNGVPSSLLVEHPTVGQFPLGFPLSRHLQGM